MSALQRWLERRREGGFLVGFVVPVYVTFAALAVSVVVACALWKGLAPGVSEGCSLHVGAALAGGRDVFEGAIAPGCDHLTLDAARKTILWDFPLIVLYAVGGTSLLWWLWPRAWRIRRVRRHRWVAAVFVAAALFDAVENVFVLVALEEGPALSDLPARAAAVAGWWKWMLLAGGASLLAAAVCGALANRRVPQPPPVVRGYDGGPVDDTIGICLSGGGIRSAGFALGALRGLDRLKILRRARWIAAVSGGAYAAGAWFVGRGSAADAARVRPQPQDGVDGLLEPPGEPDLFAYLFKHRRYLSTGRGGVAATFLTGAVLIAFHLLVLATLVSLLAWPFGRVVATWAVQPHLGDFAYGTVEAQSLDVPSRLWLPGAFGIAVAAGLFAVSLALWDPSRKRVLAVAGFGAGGGIALLALLVGIPVAMTEVPKVWDGLGSNALQGAGFASGVVVGVLAIAVAWLVARPFAARAGRLGGVLVAVLAFLLAGRVATDAAYGEGWFSWSDTTYGALLAAFGAFGVVADPQAWSLFKLYLLRLRSTFATTQDRSKRARHAPGYAGVYPLSLDAEPLWPAYVGRPGPELLVCAAAQRNGSGATGVPAQSFTFSPDAVALQDARVPASDFVRRLRAPHLGSVSASVAVSGAAFTSAMGRKSLGSTNALLAAMNVRLGVWMPNPRYAGAGPLKRPRLGYLLKELFGVYDEDDPYVYVTDGGHFENLGLVELIRRRTKWIFCVDASGDRAGSFGALEEAIVLARAVCGAEIDIDVEPLRGGRDGRLPKTAVRTGVIRYHSCGGAGADDCPTGLLFYGKAMLAADSPINTLSFSLRDRIYPRYPTYDQFLSEDEFRNLVRLGEWVGRGLALELDRFGPPP
ncbi:MAG TPA: hypothetical protein VHI71_04935 [Actinomycetota bacterium]|nr:hypothetical protein [Actinomycetota bacterium]